MRSTYGQLEETTMELIGWMFLLGFYKSDLPPSCESPISMQRQTNTMEFLNQSGVVRIWVLLAAL